MVIACSILYSHFTEIDTVKDSDERLDNKTGTSRKEGWVNSLEEDIKTLLDATNLAESNNKQLTTLVDF